MKTYNGKNITKKQIEEVLRTMNPTQIFRLVHIIYGGKVEKQKVCDFVRQFAPTQKVYNQSYYIAFDQNSCHNPNRKYIYTWDASRQSYEFKTQNIRQYVMHKLRNEIRKPRTAYTKRPMMGNTHLYFCSPVYGHSDYNKWQAMPIKGNERFCEVICKLADKYLPM